MTKIDELMRLATALPAASCGSNANYIEAVETLRTALEAALKPGEVVAWIRPSGKAMLEAGGYCTVYASEGMSTHSTPLFAAPPHREPEQSEPVGYLWPTGRHPAFRYQQQEMDGAEGTPVYFAAPPRREPLMDEQIEKLSEGIAVDDFAHDLVRRVEKHFGIGVKP